MVNVKIKGLVVTIYGTYQDGQVVEIPADYARHLVEDCRAAEYVVAKPVAQEQEQAEAPKAPTKKGVK